MLIWPACRGRATGPPLTGLLHTGPLLIISIHSEKSELKTAQTFLYWIQSPSCVCVCILLFIYTILLVTMAEYVPGQAEEKVNFWK